MRNITIKKQLKELDKKIGALLRMYRKSVGVSQQKAGDYLNVTFQQIQKYETGKNRVSASTLCSLVALYGRTIHQFHEDLDIEKNTRLEADNKDLFKMAKNFDQLDKKVQKAVLGLVVKLPKGVAA